MDDDGCGCLRQAIGQRGDHAAVQRWGCDPLTRAREGGRPATASTGRPTQHGEAFLRPAPNSAHNSRHVCSPRGGAARLQTPVNDWIFRVPEEGLEPTRPCGQRILSPSRLPFRHSGPRANSTETKSSFRHLPDSRQISRGLDRSPAGSPPPALLLALPVALPLALPLALLLALSISPFDSAWLI